ncbi:MULTISPECIES: hypothetical protein [unclassified Kitasatospora]|uniref:hypothetical protein n=1 Tax=unclassified Kitasatospora TaxID=2633591 RepID=UPI0037FF4D5A
MKIRTSLLSSSAATQGRRHVHALRIACGDARPGLIEKCSRAITAVGVRWKAVARPCGAVNVSVARKPCVALMDARIGPKY